MRNTEFISPISNTTGNRLSGNYIGTDWSGSNAVPNGKSGVMVLNGAGGNYIGGTAGTLTRNVISGNPEYGVALENTVSNTVLGNFIGVDAGGNTSLGNTLGGVGMFSGAQHNVIGGAGAFARNVISGNAQYGVLLIGAVSNAVQGNFIGPDSTGQAAPANDNAYGGIGVWGGAADNLIGGLGPAGNLISGNNSYGVFLADPGTSGNVLEGNFIGTDWTGTNALGNWFAGVAVWGGANSNLIGSPVAGSGNAIAFNGWSGVALYDAPTTNNAIRGNSIFDNGGLGIDFYNDGVTTNHNGFAAGPNNLQNFPVITNAVGGSFGTIVRGTLNSLPNQNYFLDFYRNPAADPSGYGQGEFYLGSVAVTTDISGNAGFASTNVVFDEAGQYLSATATAATGDTSEFSADVLATSVTSASAQITGPFAVLTNGFAFSLILQTNFSYRIQAATNLGTSPIPWIDLTNVTPADASLTFTDRAATNFPARFYRVVSP